MRSPIEFFLRNDSPQPIENLSIRVEGEDFSALLKSDQKVIQEEWGKVVDLNSKAFSKQGGLGTLYDTTRGLHYRPTEFMHYVAISRTHQERPLDSDAYGKMRVGAVGVALELADGNIFVHKRSEKATHAAGFWDSSCAGFCHVDQRTMHPQSALYEKLERELGLKREEVTLTGITGVHSSAAPDFSGMIDVACKTGLDSSQVRQRIKPGIFPEYDFVPKDLLPPFIIDHYSERRDMIGDGAATLLGILDKETFDAMVACINHRQEVIRFGKLENGAFLEQVRN